MVQGNAAPDVDALPSDGEASRNGNRVFAIGIVLGFAVWAVARANPWNFVVVADYVRPAALVVWIGILVYFAVRAIGAMAGIGIAVVAAGFVAVPVASSWFFGDLAEDASVFGDPASDLRIEVHWPICSSAGLGPIHLIADRGLASRRVTIAYLEGECPDVEVRFPSESGVLLLGIGGTPYRIEFDPHTLQLAQDPVRNPGLTAVYR